MWRSVVPAATLVVVLVLLLVPFHPESTVLQALVAVTPKTALSARLDWLLVETGGNLLLFSAVGAAALLLLRRRVAAFAAATTLSAAAELAQLVIPDRVASFTDFVTNALGAGLGVLLASCVIEHLRARAEERA